MQEMRRLRQLILQVEPCAGISSRSSKSSSAVESKNMFDNTHTDGPAPTLKPNSQTGEYQNAPEAGTKPMNDPSGLWGRGYEHSNVREKLPQVPKDVTFNDGMRNKYVEWINKRKDKSGNVKGLTQWQSLTDSKLFRDKVDEDPYTEPSPPRPPVLRDVEVVICGVGFAGILCGARMKQAGIDDILMMEKGGDVGGTWYWNRYPGIACDVESYAYMPLLSETDYIPTMKYASGFEIQEHCRRIMNHFDLYPKFMGHTTITGTTWNEGTKRWTVRTDKNDDVKARFVILCNGIMTVPRLTKLPGMDDYTGVTFHTSRWDYSHDLRGKKVGVIGTGCTACQAIPELAKVVGELYVFQRTPSSIDVRNNIRTSEKMEAEFRATPGWDQKRRDNYDAFLGEGRGRDKPSRKKVAELTEAEQQEITRKQLENNFRVAHAIRMRVPTKVKDPKTAEALQQWCTMGSKRPVFHDEYLSSFNLPHVHLIDTEGAGVERVTAKGPVANGQEWPVDVLIYATGFEHMVTGTFNEIRNAQGLSMKEKWADGTKTFLGDHTAGFPNLMIINGPQAAGATFNMLSQCDVQVQYMVTIMKHMREKGHTTIDVTPEAEQKFAQHCADSDRRQQTTRWGPYAAISYYNWQGTKRYGDTEYVGGKKYFGFQDEALNSLKTGKPCGTEFLNSGELDGVHVYKFT